MLNSSSEKHKLRRQDEKVIRPILKLIPISEHSQLETKKREYWIRTITKEAPKALRCTHVQGGSPNRRIYGSTYEVKVALNGYGWTLKKSRAEAIIPSSGTQPSAHLRKDGALPCKVDIASTHALPRHPRGFPMVKPLKLSTLNSQLECTVIGVGASETLRS